LRNAAAALRVWLTIVALPWATLASAQPAGTQGAVVPQHGPITSKSPAIVLLKQQNTLANTCGGSAFDVNTFIDVDTSASADVKVAAPGVGLIEEFTDNTGANIGPFNSSFPGFHIPAFGGGLPPNTPITITITTYTGTNLTGPVSSVSSLTFDCTSGVVLKAPASRISDIPALSPVGVAATTVLLLLFASAMLGRMARRRAR
jgi:hypothetical protein